MSRAKSNCVVERDMGMDCVQRVAPKSWEAAALCELPAQCWLRAASRRCQHLHRVYYVLYCACLSGIVVPFYLIIGPWPTIVLSITIILAPAPAAFVLGLIVRREAMRILGVAREHMSPDAQQEARVLWLSICSARPDAISVGGLCLYSPGGVVMLTFGPVVMVTSSVLAMSGTAIAALWFLFGVAAYAASIGVLLCLVKIRRTAIAQTLRSRLCLRCGYHVNCEVNRCPECGYALPLTPIDMGNL